MRRVVLRIEAGKVFFARSRACEDEAAVRTARDAEDAFVAVQKVSAAEKTRRIPRAAQRAAGFLKGDPGFVSRHLAITSPLRWAAEAGTVYIVTGAF